MIPRLVVAVCLLALSCSTAAPRPGDRFWRELHSLCGKTFTGALVEGTEPSDAAIGQQTLTMHVASCTAGEIRIPFHVGADRSRTWIVTRTPDGLRLKHDHRHEDGSEDRISRYGGDTQSLGADDLSIDFHADAYTAQLIPTAATNIWTMRIEPRRTFTYALRRANRRFRVDFDLTN
jgi:hypothetical protein